MADMEAMKRSIRNRQKLADLEAGMKKKHKDEEMAMMKRSIENRARLARVEERLKKVYK